MEKFLKMWDCATIWRFEPDLGREKRRVQAHREEGLPPAWQGDADYLWTVKGGGKQHTDSRSCVSKQR